MSHAVRGRRSVDDTVCSQIDVGDDLNTRQTCRPATPTKPIAARRPGRPEGGS